MAKGSAGSLFGEATEEVQRLQEKAKEQCGNMTPTERGSLIMKMQKKVEIIAKMPVEDRQRHMKRLPEDEQIEFMKAQILMQSMMRQQMAQQAAQHNHPQHQPNCPHHQHQADCPNVQAPGGDASTADAGPWPKEGTGKPQDDVP